MQWATIRTARESVRATGQLLYVTQNTYASKQALHCYARAQNVTNTTSFSHLDFMMHACN